MVIIGLLLVIAIGILIYASHRYRQMSVAIQRRINLIDNAFKYVEYVYAEAAKNRDNAKKGQVKSFYTGRMSAAVDILKYIEQIDKLWDRK